MTEVALYQGGANMFDIMMAIFVYIIFIFIILPNYDVW
jgi:hypothetical protein